MSRYQIAARIVPVPTIGGHIDVSARVSVRRAPWEASEVRAGARPESAPGAASIRAARPRAANIASVLRIIRQEHQAHGEARQ